MTSAELGALLRERFTGLKEKYSSQQALAMSWYEQHGDTKLGSGTVESRLSELFNGKLDGVKFFFAQRDRSAVLLRLLGITTAEAEQVYASAELALAGQLDARTLLDLRAMTDAEVQAACKWIESAVLQHSGLLPLVLLVLPGQAKQIPRGFDDYREKGQLTWTEEVGKAAERATVLLAPTPWALGPDRQMWPWQKWAQLGFASGMVQLDPLNALGELANRGALPSPPMVKHELAELGAQPDLPGAAEWLESQGVTWRSAVQRVLAGTDTELVQAVSPPVRLALAARLGLKAGASEHELVEHEIACVGAEIGASKVEHWAEDQLKACLDKARLRPQGPVVARVGDTLHAINWLGCDGRETGGRLVVQRIDAPVPAIDAVRARLAELAAVEFQFRDDLEALVDDLVAQGHDRLAVRHACATLYLRRELVATGGAAALVDELPEGRAERDRELALAVLAHRYTPALLHVPGEALDAELSGDSLDVPTPGGRLISEGQKKLKVAALSPRSHLRLNCASGSGANPWYPLLAVPLNADVWLDGFDRWGALDTWLRSPLTVEREHELEVAVDWVEVQAFCALLQLNLRRGAAACNWHEVGQRRYLLPLGSGVCAEVAVNDSWRSKDRLLVAAAGLQDHRAVTAVWRTLRLIAGDANCGPRVLNQVTFAAGKVHLKVTFHADPFTASGVQAWPAVAAKVEAGARARRHRDDD